MTCYRRTCSTTPTSSGSTATGSTRCCSRHKFAGRIAQDVESADLSGVSGTPSFFINGQRHYGAYDAQTLAEAIKVARARANIGRARSERRASAE